MLLWTLLYVAALAVVNIRASDPQSLLPNQKKINHTIHQVYDRIRFFKNGDLEEDVTANVNDILDDNVNSVEDVYENCEEVETCTLTEVEECGVCHSVYMRECNIDMQFYYTPVKVKECTEDPECEGGYKRSCYTKYFSECSTKFVYKDMEEDHPVCSVTKQDRCTSSGCRKVPVMSCKIQKKTSRKSKPVTSCERIPRQVCSKDKCSPVSCYERVVMNKEMVPKETCQYKEKRICQETDEVGCRTVTKRECRPLPAGTPCVRQTGSAATAGRAAPRQPKEIISSDRQQLTALADSFDSFQATSSTTARTTPMTTARTTPKTTTTARPTIVASSAPTRRYYARPIYHRRYHYSLSP